MLIAKSRGAGLTSALYRNIKRGTGFSGKEAKVNISRFVWFLSIFLTVGLGLFGCEDDPVGPKDPTPTPTPRFTATPVATATPVPTPTPCPEPGATIDGWERSGNCNIKISGRCWGIGCNNLRLGIFIAPTKPNVHQWFYQGMASINESAGTWSGGGHLGPNATQCSQEEYCLAVMPLARDCSFPSVGPDNLESNICRRGPAAYWPYVRY